MCDDSGPCAENELNYMISRSDAYPWAVTPTCATLNKSHTLPCCDVNAHPCAVTPTCATLNKSHTLPCCDVNAHPCAVTPTCAIPSKSNTLPCCDVNAHPCAADMYVRCGGNHTLHCCTGGAPLLVAHLLNVLPVRYLTLPCARNTPLGWKLIGTAACVPAFLRFVRTAPRAHTAQKHKKHN